MEYRQMGSSGVRVSVVGLGTNRFGSPDMPQAEVNKVIDAAVETGVNFLDTPTSTMTAHRRRPWATRSKGVWINSSSRPSSIFLKNQRQ